MKYIDKYSSDVFKSTAVENLFDRFGEQTTDKTKAFAKTLSSTVENGDDIIKYYVITHNNVPYDPYGIDSHREKNLKTVLRSTSKQVFDDYITYLKTKNRLYMTRTQRNFIHV